MNLLPFFFIFSELSHYKNGHQHVRKMWNRSSDSLWYASIRWILQLDHHITINCIYAFSCLQVTQVFPERAPRVEQGSLVKQAEMEWEESPEPMEYPADPETGVSNMRVGSWLMSARLTAGIKFMLYAVFFDNDNVLLMTLVNKHIRLLLALKLQRSPEWIKLEAEKNFLFFIGRTYHFLPRSFFYQSGNKSWRIFSRTTRSSRKSRQKRCPRRPGRSWS